MLYGKSGNEKYGRAENNGRASGRAASRAIRLRHQFSVLSSRFYLCVPLCTSVFPVVQALVLYHRGHRGTQVTLSNPPPTPVVSSQLLVPSAWGTGNAHFLQPRLQRLFQLHPAG